MPDTAANQAVYPQPDAQKPGLGFPIVRAVVIFCLATGAAIDAALGSYRGKSTGEAALLRDLVDALTPSDVLLGDRGFGSFFDLALMRSRGVDAVVRLHQTRRTDFRTGRRLGRRDHTVRWPRPDRPAWVDETTYARLAEGLEVREVDVRVRQPGFRTRGLVIVTTLLDASRYPAETLAELYRARWHAELDLRSLKGTMGLDVLRCKTPEMVRKEFWAHMLAYNLIRSVMANAAWAEGCVPRELSFAGALQAVQAFGSQLVEAEGERAEELRRVLMATVGGHRVGGRPDRIEPRARKRRPKHGAILTKPWDQARAELRKGLAA